jgi:hypothetical protein
MLNRICEFADLLQQNHNKQQLTQQMTNENMASSTVVTHYNRDKTIDF